MSARRRIKKRVLRAGQPQPIKPTRPAVERRRCWPSLIIEVLPDLWSGHSAEGVAEILTRVYEFKCTRNAVIGKIHRLRAAGTTGFERKGRL